MTHAGREDGFDDDFVGSVFLAHALFWAEVCLATSWVGACGLIFPVGVVVREQRNDVVAHQGLVGRNDVVRQSGTMSWNQTPPGAQLS